MPATYAAISAALKALRIRAPDFAPRSVLDAGAGPGTASWAALAQWSEIESVTMVDENETMLGAAREFCAAATIPALNNPRLEQSRIAALKTGETFDLVIAGYVLAELADPSPVVEALWSAAKQGLVIVEPGTPDGFERIRRARDFLIKSGAEIAAPCPHQKSCPIKAPDWCHFAQRLSRSRDHMHAKGARLPFEDEKFAYLAAVRGVALTPPAPRILDRPDALKFGVRFKLCTAEGTPSAS